MGITALAYLWRPSLRYSVPRRPHQGNCQRGRKEHVPQRQGDREREASKGEDVLVEQDDGSGQGDPDARVREVFQGGDGHAVEERVAGAGADVRDVEEEKNGGGGGCGGGGGRVIFRGDKKPPRLLDIQRNELFVLSSC